MSNARRHRLCRFHRAIREHKPSAPIGPWLSHCGSFAIGGSEPRQGRRRRAPLCDPSGSRGRRRSLPCRNPRCSLIGPPDREDVCSFHFGTSLLAACPSGPGFFMNIHKIDAKRKYPIASTCHAGVDDATEGELEHHIPNSETALGRFHEVETAQTGLRQRMIVGEFEDRHQRATLWSPSTDASLPRKG